MAAIAPDLADGLDAARIAAASQGHAEVAVEHLLQSLFQSSAPALAYLSSHAIGVRALKDAVRRSLEAVPVQAGYRGSGQPPSLSRDLVSLLDRAGRARWWSRRVETPWLLEAFFDSTEGAALRDAARFDVRSVLALRESAEALARALGHHHVLVDHALGALLEQARFARAVRACSVEPVVARNRLFVRMGRRTRSYKLASAADLVSSASASANGRERRELALPDLVVSILRNSRCHPAVARMELDVYDLLVAYVHQSPVEDLESMSPGAERVEIWVHDDEYTAMEHVVDVLTQELEMGPERAHAAMLAVHERTSACVGTYPRAWALERLRLAKERARRTLMPMRVTLRPA